MFALALWDRGERVLYLARDRFGEKPLYYGWAGGAFVFGSELKALRAWPGFANPVSRDALALYMQFCTVPAPYSIYEDVFKLEPGCVLTLPASGLAERDVRIAPYWSFAEAARRGLARPIADEAEAVGALEEALKRSVAQQSVADVPLGAFLSGGVDSSAIVALMQAQSSRRVQTFTVGFDESGFDESPHAQAVAAHLGTEHHALRVSAGDARAVIPALPTLYDEPFADSSQIPTHLVCRAARRGVTVALSGDAGDEVFGGYNRYVWGRGSGSAWGGFRCRCAGRSVRRRCACRSGAGTGLRAQVPGSEPGGSAGVQGAQAGRAPADHAQPGRPVPRAGERVAGGLGHRDRRPKRLPIRLDDAALVAGIDAPEQRMMLWDTLTYLPDDILTKVDRAAMGVSLETRVPFLDHRVVELAWRLPLHMKIRNGQGKWALRQVLYKYVPRELIERPKAGFAIPVGEWLRGPLREWAEALLDERRLAREGYLNPAPIRAVWAQHLSGRYDWTLRLWCVLMFQAWLEANS
jgi:asparagine synthase (glutamine-hydrolysing)